LSELTRIPNLLAIAFVPFYYVEFNISILNYSTCYKIRIPDGNNLPPAYDPVI
jgi:hypothetical protein